ncbi:MAG: dihydroneopterin aldolase, partial [Burkholderiales bacterium]|nr:dihydroneopterin aldolase [Burkholderiales bacterium]
MMISQPRTLDGAATANALDLIFIEGFSGETVIGIDSSELHLAQPLVIDVHAGVPRARACDTDRIADTIHYGLVCERLRRLLREHRVQLLEACAEAIANILIDEFGAAWVRVKVVKPRKFDDVQAVGVQIEREASARRETPHRGAAMLRLIGSGLIPGDHGDHGAPGG